MPDVKPPRYYGPKHPNSKLSTRDVDDIRALRVEGWSYMRLARRFGVTKQQIAHIVKGRQRVFA